MKHADCGGNLVRWGKHHNGIYRCEKCQGRVALGVQTARPCYSTRNIDNYDISISANRRANREKIKK